VPAIHYLTSPVIPIDGERELGELLAANDTPIPVHGKGDSIISPNILLSDILITPSILQPIVSPQLLIQDTNSSILLSNQHAYLVSDSVQKKSCVHYGWK
jgi:hypothetical protein